MAPRCTGGRAARARLALAAGLVAVSCGAGSFTTDPRADGGPEDAGDGDVEAPVDCEGVVCPPGQSCVEGRCSAPDPCEGMACPDGQTCSAGRCVATGTDVDGDGYPVERDCDDGDPAVHPGIERACTTGCGAGTDRCGEDGTWSGCHHDEDPCVLPHAAAACVDDSCVIVACAEGYSHCDTSQANGCETEGECAPDGLACGELIGCVLGCPDDTCAALCALRACSGSSAALLAMLDCGQRACGDPCSDLRSPACESCITASCRAEYDACLAAGC